MNDREPAIGLSSRRLVVLFLFGATVLTLFDGFHTFSGTTRYPTPLIWGTAWWVPLNFGLSTAVGGSIYAYTYRALGGRRAPPAWSRLAPGLAIFGGLYAFSGFFHGANETKLLVLGAAALGLFLWLDRSRAGAACLIVTALTGPLVEAVLVQAGAFEHLQPDILRVPMWLPALYACSAPVVGQGARRCLLETASPGDPPV